jgi:hypothetical protein
MRLPPWHWRLPAAVAHALALARDEGAGVTRWTEPDGARCARADGVRPNGDAERALLELPGCRHDGTGFVWTAPASEGAELSS